MSIEMPNEQPDSRRFSAGDLMFLGKLSADMEQSALRGGTISDAEALREGMEIALDDAALDRLGDGTSTDTPEDYLADELLRAWRANVDGVPMPEIPQQKTSE